MKRAMMRLSTGLIFVFLTGCGNGRPGDAQAKEAQMADINKKAPDLEMVDINGRPFRLADYKGNVIILNFFATWCPPCRAEMPDFNRLAGEYPDSVTIIAISAGGESPAAVKNFAVANNLKFIVAMDDGTASALYGPIRTIPVSVIIDRDFKVARRYTGQKPKEVFAKDIEALK